MVCDTICAFWRYRCLCACLETHLIDLDVLGPLVVRAGGRQLRLGPTLRVLLLGLLCAGGDLIPAGRLGAMSAGNGSSAVSPATLRSHVAHLRRAVNDAAGLARDERESVIVTGHVGGGTAYGLRLDAVTVDASRFVREAALGMGELRSGDPGRAAVTLRAALELWRGEPLADVKGHSFAQAEIRRLEAVYRAALVGRVRADAWCGLGLSVIGELQSLVERWPDDEELRVLLVTCLYRSGRTAEAARACRSAVEFTLEHGLESRRLADLQMKVLAGTLQPDLRGDVPVPASSPVTARSPE
jgi:DNA-binding SARP family transcriptional activator